MKGDAIPFAQWVSLVACGLDPERAASVVGGPPDSLATEILLRELAPAASGELAGAPRYLEGAMPSHLRDGMISLLYALYLPAWGHLGLPGPLILAGDDTAHGISLWGICGPPGASCRAFSAEIRLEDLACSGPPDLRRLWRLVVTTDWQRPPRTEHR